MVALSLVLLSASAAAEPPAVISLQGSGTTNPSKLYWQAIDLITARSKLPLHITYRAVGSSTGQKEFGDISTVTNADGSTMDVAGPAPLNDFGSGDIPYSAGRYAALTAAGRKMVHVPMAVGGIGVFHSVPEAELGGAPLHLTACLLAKIFSRQITHWDDAEIKAANPSLTSTGEIKVVHRVKGSSSTTGFTEYMDGSCQPSWSGAAWAVGKKVTGSSITWPESTFGAQGSGGMSDFLVENAYGIGYIDSGHGHDAELAEVALENRNGKYLKTTEADIGAAATYALEQAVPLIPSDPTADFSSVNLYDLPGDTTWPITMITYIYLPADMSSMDPATAGLLMYWVFDFILGPEGQELASNKYNKFVPIPQKLQEYNTLTKALLLSTLPPDTPDFKTETDTLIKTGMGDYYISGKRRDYAEVERERFVGDMEVMEAAVPMAPAAVTEAEVEEMKSQIAALAAASLPPPPAVTEAEVEDLKNQIAALEEETQLAKVGVGLGAAGLALGVIALLAALFNKPRPSAPRSQEIPVRNLEKPTSATSAIAEAEKV